MWRGRPWQRPCSRPAPQPGSLADSGLTRPLDLGLCHLLLLRRQCHQRGQGERHNVIRAEPEPPLPAMQLGQSYEGKRSKQAGPPQLHRGLLLWHVHPEGHQPLASAQLPHKGRHPCLLLTPQPRKERLAQPAEGRADGVMQTMVLSLPGLKFSNHHLELNLPPGSRTWTSLSGGLTMATKHTSKSASIHGQ